LIFDRLRQNAKDTFLLTADHVTSPGRSRYQAQLIGGGNASFLAQIRTAAASLRK
jgi:hypothetical protein